jgi:SAM-dependent methyltransferase
MPTHSAVAGFDKAADAYERGRPGYPPEAIEFLVKEFEIGPGTRIVDLGAGTGKFTRAMASTGATVVALEPTRAMRALHHRLDPTTRLMAGNAERLPLRSGSADVVVAAQAFHWFATSGTVNEIARVLRPGGGLGLVWNTRDETVPWTARLGALINARSGGIPRYRSGRWKRVLDGRPEFTPLQHVQYPHAQRADVETLVDRVLSISVIALLPPVERDALAQDVRLLLATDPATRDRAVLDLPYRTDVYVSHRRAAGSPGARPS